MKSKSFQSNKRIFSFEQRVIHIERLLISALIFATSTYNLINQNYILETYLGENAIYPSIILFFISYVFAIIYFTFVIIATSDEAGNQLVNFIFKHKSWIVIPLVGFSFLFLISSLIFILIFVLGYELNEILGPIIISIIMIMALNFFKASTWIKKQLEQNEFDEYD